MLIDLHVPVSTGRRWLVVRNFKRIVLNFLGSFSKYFSLPKSNLQVLYILPLDELNISFDHVWINWSFNLCATAFFIHFSLTCSCCCHIFEKKYKFWIYWMTTFQYENFEMNFEIYLLLFLLYFDFVCTVLVSKFKKIRSNISFMSQ